jgi:hypothetical protein
MNIDDLVAKLRQHLASLGDGRDARSDNERAAYRREYDTTQRTLGGLLNEPADVARRAAEVAALESRRAAVLAKQRELEQAITDAPPWREHPDARERDRRYDHVANLRRQLEFLARGTLLVGPGICFERVADLDAQIAERTARRDRAQAALDEHLRQAEQLLSVAVTG